MKIWLLYEHVMIISEYVIYPYVGIVTSSGPVIFSEHEIDLFVTNNHLIYSTCGAKHSSPRLDAVC